MRKIDNLGAIGGRELLRSIYRDLRYEKQRNAFVSLLITWRIAVGEIELSKYTGQEINVLHSLGYFKGTSLWLEEIVNRFYFSTINSLVYFGAAILLVLIGVRRFSDNVSDELVIWGIIFEAAMLMFMFFIMLFTPSDELDTDDDESLEKQQEIITEIGEISRDFAAATVQLERITDKLDILIDKQSAAANSMAEMANNMMNIASPNPEMINIMSNTNTELLKFKETVASLIIAVEQAQSEEIRNAVRKEMESLFVGRIKADEKSKV